MRFREGGRAARALRRISSAVAKVVLSLLLAIVIAACLARLAPGWDTDEAALDARLSEETLARRSADRGAGTSVPAYVFGYAARIVRGDFGRSVLFDRPCAELIQDRAPVTLRVVGTGLLTGFAGALLFAGWRAAAGGAFLEAAQNGLVAALLSVPPPILGLAAAALRLPGEVAAFLIVFPRMLRYAGTLFAEHGRSPFVLAAHGLGIPPARLVAVHILPVSLPALAAFAGALAPVTLSAAVPLEVAGDIPGLGHLAWRATIGRDVPLLLATTLVIAAISVAANAAAEAVCERGR